MAASAGQFDQLLTLGFQTISSGLLLLVLVACIAFCIFCLFFPSCILNSFLENNYLIDDEDQYEYREITMYQ